MNSTMICDLNTTVLTTNALFDIVVIDTAFKNSCWLGLSCNNIRVWIILQTSGCWVLVNRAVTAKQLATKYLVQQRNYVNLQAWVFEKYNLHLKLDIVCFQRTVQLFNAYQP